MKTILLLTDFSERAERAADMALEMAISNSANLILYNSIILLDPESLYGDNQFAEKEILRKIEISTKKLQQLSDRLNLERRKRASSIEIKYKEGTGAVSDTVQYLVSEYQVWMIVMGCHVSSELRYQFSDSNVYAVVSNSGCPVLLVP